MSLVVIGTVAFDAIETPFGKTDKIVGGSASYVGLSASYFNQNPKLVAVVGDDFPAESIDVMKRRGFHLDGLQIKEGEKSFFWSGRYHDNMNQRDTLITELNVLETFDPIIPDAYQDCQYLMLGNLAPVVQKQVIDRLQNRPKLVVMDTMNFWMDIAMDDLKETLKHVDVLTINDEEARQLSGEYALVTAARKILTMGPKYLIIKKGEHGALLFGEDKMFYVPALPLERVVDPTGAGDTFAGGFIGYLAQQGEVNFENMKRALIYGSAMASFVVQEFGTVALEDLKPEQVKERVQQFLELSRVHLDAELA